MTAPMRVAAAAAAAVLLAVNAAPTAAAMGPPVINPAALPPDGPPGPEVENRQSSACAAPVVVGDPDVTQPPRGNMMPLSAKIIATLRDEEGAAKETLVPLLVMTDSYENTPIGLMMTVPTRALRPARRSG